MPKRTVPILQSIRNPPDDYAEFLARKMIAAQPCGFEPIGLPNAMKSFQRDIVTWSCRRGRSAIFAGTGLGKTLQELAWLQQVCRHTQGETLLLTPLAVAEQTIQEAAKFGIEGVAYAADPSEIRGPITVTNYDRRERFDLDRFAGLGLDESGIIRDQDSKTRADLTARSRDIAYLLCGSALPAPNDWTELGQHAEFLGVMSAQEMLATFFVHEGAVRANAEDEWRLKRHATADFWRWLASWSVMIRHPRDLGYDEPGYDLPPLYVEQVTVKVPYAPIAGMLFPMAASTMGERIASRRDSVAERVAAAAEIVNCSWLSTGSPAIIGADTTKAPECGSLNITTPGPSAATQILRDGPESGPHADLPKTTRSTCEPITPQTGTIGQNELQSSKTGTTRADASDTPRIQTSENASVRKTKSIRRTGQRETTGSKENSGLTISNMQPSWPTRAEDALSAEPSTQIREATNSTSIMITQQVASAVPSARPATSALESFRMMQSYSPEPSDTLPIPWLIWCQLNKEQDALEAAFGSSCVSIFGSMTRGEKISQMMKWVRGDVPVMISKPSIFGRGLNYQHCAHMIFVGLNDSFEQVFQAMRRCWRFGQTKPVTAYMIASELDGAVVANLKAKERRYEQMAEGMVGHMRELSVAEVRGGRVSTSNYDPQVKMQLPGWML